ncbi:MAG: class I SAM-dependent methyltransferase [Rhizobiales bacterium]|nr:class I SAM-dependent methyltransferase [Hyphomicrobiales bacterium]MBO6698974.1 class I SAM-dependent methyltransferase [Hyphomicrobiales bacterium]MBO6734773.1 class I SAM-dependent methyltransferase [Hyphomicrobiales bacterium]MBO6911421.1 class I SAM-dependent methyltransferase [Hyphomicrobiales bacterium]MBO6955446.1 class I SAM-dependent methyltransferase [Hyphomicrobiales bacterium]
MKLTNYLDPRRYWVALRQQIARLRYDLPTHQAEEKAKFSALGFDIDAGRAQLNTALAAIESEPYDDVTGTDSVHWLLFAALSLTPRGQTVRNILEIGTFRGKTTLLLKALFPAAQIVTCDLPDDDPILTSSYRRDTAEALAEYKSVRDQRVGRPGITFVEANSFFLPEKTTGPYDLIWMDGGHLYPEVAWDFCNSWHMCRPGGIIMCDDVIPNPRGAVSYAADESHRVISYAASRTGVAPLYFLKRLNPQWSADPVTRKFVAWLEKPTAGTDL